MKITAKTRKSHYWNEDRFVLGKDYFMVIDGATPLIKSNNFNEACWLVTYVKENINKLTGSIEERLNVLSKEAYNLLPVKIKEEDYMPSASLAYVEVLGDEFSAHTLGDCEVTFVLKDGKIIRCFETELAKFDNISIKELVQHAKDKNIHVVNARPFIKDTLLKHRNMINKPNGYKGFSLTSNPEIKTSCFIIKKDLVKEIYIYSDGFSQSFEHLNVYNTHEEMFSKSLDLDEEILKIKNQSFLDPYCDKYPRLKKIDDITVIKIELE